MSKEKEQVYSPFRAGVKKFFKNPFSVTGLVVLVALVLFAVIGPMVTGYDQETMDMMNMLKAPTAQHLLGTDDLGRDILTRLACGGRVRRLTLRFADLRIDAAGLGYRQELLAALAGPLVNLVCGALFCMRSPAFAAYSLMLGIYNLLPVWPLDGGRAVRCALAQHLPLARAEAVSRRSSFAVCAALLLAGIILTFFRRAGLWPLGTAAYLTLRLLTLAKRTGE